MPRTGQLRAGSLLQPTHESVAKIYAGLPAKLAPQLKEGAFSMKYVTFGGWHDGTQWTLRGNAKPMAEELEILSGAPAKYRAYATSYFEETVPTTTIAHVLAGKKLTPTLVTRTSKGERTLASMKSDLVEIGYGKAG